MTRNISDVLAQVDQYIDPRAIAEECLAFVQTKSETVTEGPGALFLADMLRKRGWNPTIEPVLADRPNVNLRVPGTGGGRTLLFNGHVDTIPIGVSVPPKIEDDWVWGRGTEDMKGGLTAMVHAMDALRRAGVRLKGDVWLTGVVGHETPAGKKEGPRYLIKQMNDGAIRPDAILIVEGPYAIWSASLGSTIFHFHLRANRPPIHTIKVPYKENPVRWLAPLLAEIDRLDDNLGERPPHHLAGRDQINVGIVSAGDYFNRLPVHAVITGTRRWPPGRTFADVKAELEDLCSRITEASGHECTVEFEGTREPFETPGDHPIVRALETAGEQVSGERPKRIGMGLVGDANLYFNDAKVPTVYYGPAHQTAHSDEERVSISQLTNLARTYARVAIEFCGLAEA